MDRFVDMGRAAHLAGVTYEEIATHIAAGELHVAKGRIQVADLRRVYPDIDLTGSKMVDVVNQIREDAILKASHAKSGRMTVNDLLHENRQLKRDLRHFSDRCDTHKSMLRDMRGMLLALKPHVSEPHRVQNIVNWLDQKMKRLR